jgi:hypothetical protein
MVLSALLAVSLIVPAAADAGTLWPPSASGGRHMSVQQKLSVIRPLVDTANECVARSVTADPRYKTVAQAGEINGLIVDSVPSCVEAMRALIEAQDRMFGEGAGESYFMGPYLDALPSAIEKYLNGSR